jgi:hypothetical protein
MEDRPRTFEEVVAATDPEELARLNRGEKYNDPAVADPNQREVCVHEDRYGSGEWLVSYFDDDGGCYVTLFAGPEAEWGAREYFGALKAGQLRAIRVMMVPSTTVNAIGRG